MTPQAAGRELTGRKVLAITLGAFGIIIAVNLVMAWFAVSSFPGLEVRNSWVAGQGFNQRLRDQRALGWDVTAELESNRLTLRLTDAQGGAAPVAAISAILGRPTTQREDIVPEFRFENGAFVADVAAGPGNWDLRIRAEAGDGTPFEYRMNVLHR